MPQISKREFERLPLRAHQFLAGVPLHDAWAVDLPSLRAGITLDEFLRATNERPYTPTPVVRALLDLRLLIGRILGCDRPRTSMQTASMWAEVRIRVKYTQIIESNAEPPEINAKSAV